MSSSTAMNSSIDRGTQELKILAVVVIGDRCKWLMRVESCYSRNWNARPTGLQEINKWFNLFAPGGLQIEMGSEPLCAKEGMPGLR